MSGLGIIQQLDEQVVHRIAAGEVIQRPCSALKELLENSIDAGSTQITVTLQQKGLKLLEVKDNGSGIGFADLPILCHQHTTSKLRQFEDLQSIQTHGFRGEALCSISFVSNLTVVSKTKESEIGYRVEYRDGEMVGEPQAVARPQGTTIIVEDMFYNVQTRRRAMGTGNEEYKRMFQVMGKLAIHHHNLQLILKRQENKNFDLQSHKCSDQTNSIRTVYGKKIADNLMRLKFQKIEDDSDFNLEVDGLITNSGFQGDFLLFVLFVNDRLVECDQLRKVVEKSYEGILPKNSKPFVYLNLKLPGNQIDVNMHPTKQQVGFLYMEKIIKAIKDEVEKLLVDGNQTQDFLLQNLKENSLKLTDNFYLGGNSNSSSDISKNSKNSSVNPAKLIRTDHKTQKIDKFFDNVDSQIAQKVAMIPKRKTKNQIQNQNLNQTSLKNSPFEIFEQTNINQENFNGQNNLKNDISQKFTQEISEREHNGISQILSEFTFVGMADEMHALLQHKTILYLINLQPLIRDLFTQQIIQNIRKFSPIELNPPTSIFDLGMIAIDFEEIDGRWTEADGKKEEICELIVQLFVENKEWLKKYFQIEINDENQLVSLPEIFEGIVPDEISFPQFVFNLAKNVKWEIEGDEHLYQQVSEVISECYSDSIKFQLFNLYEQAREQEKEKEKENIKIDENTQDTLQQQQKQQSSQQSYMDEHVWYVQHVLLELLKRKLVPDKKYATDGTVKEVARLEKLYQIFERC